MAISYLTAIIHWYIRRHLVLVVIEEVVATLITTFLKRTCSTSLGPNRLKLEFCFMLRDLLGSFRGQGISPIGLQSLVIIANQQSFDDRY